MPKVIFDTKPISRYNERSNTIHICYRGNTFKFLKSFIHETLHYLFHKTTPKPVSNFLDGLLDYVCYGWVFFKVLGEEASPFKQIFRCSHEPKTPCFNV